MQPIKKIICTGFEFIADPEEVAESPAGSFKATVHRPDGSTQVSAIDAALLSNVFELYEFAEFFALHAPSYTKDEIQTFHEKAKRIISSIQYPGLERDVGPVAGEIPMVGRKYMTYEGFVAVIVSSRVDESGKAVFDGYLEIDHMDQNNWPRVVWNMNGTCDDDYDNNLVKLLEK